jgi:hypothetical protein
MHDTTHKKPTSQLPLSDSLEEIFARNADLWLTTYGELLANLDALTHAWLHRSRNGVAAMHQALQHMTEWQNPQETLRIQQELLSDAIRRATENLAALSNGISSLTERATGEFAKAVRKVSEPPCAVSDEMLKAAGNKPPTRLRTRDHQDRSRVGIHIQ